MEMTFARGVDKRQSFDILTSFTLIGSASKKLPSAFPIAMAPHRHSAPRQRDHQRRKQAA